MGQTVNLLAYAFGGSNPSLPTKARLTKTSESRFLLYLANINRISRSYPLSSLPITSHLDKPTTVFPHAQPEQ